MAGQIDARLKELGITLPAATLPQGSYVPYAVTGSLVFLAGQIPLADGKMQHPGIVPTKVTLEQANAAARICAVTLLNQLKAACGGDLDRVMRCVKVGGFVACEPSFTDHPKVVNGASDFFARVFGDKAKHARVAVGAPWLPLGASVEVEAIFEIK